MKKIVIFVILCLLLTFVSCDSQVTNPTTTPTKTPVKTVAPTATPTKTPVKTVAPTATPTKTPVKTVAPTTTPTRTPVKTVTPMATPRPVQNISSNIAIGDIVKYGFYEQDNNTANGQEEIEWIVLDVKDGKALLISKYGLDCQPYNTTYTNVTWETCTLRNWLNTTFYTTAFNTNQQSKIISTRLTNADNPFYGTEGGNNTTDKVFLLSIDEAEQYFSSDTARIVTATEYARGPRASDWWLRSPGYYSLNAAYVDYDGSVYSNSIVVYFDAIAVRPALWINLES